MENNKKLKMKKNIKKAIKIIAGFYAIIFIILIILGIASTFGTKKEENISEILKNNGYEIKEYTQFTTYDKNNIMFVIYKDDDNITIAYEDEYSTATLMFKNINNIEKNDCKLDLNNESETNCNDQDKEWLEKAHKEIIKELDNINIKH